MRRAFEEDGMRFVGGVVDRIGEERRLLPSEGGPKGLAAGWLAGGVAGC